MWGGIGTGYSVNHTVNEVIDRGGSVGEATFVATTDSLVSWSATELSALGGLALAGAAGLGFGATIAVVGLTATAGTVIYSVAADKPIKDVASSVYKSVEGYIDEADRQIHNVASEVSGTNTSPDSTAISASAHSLVSTPGIFETVEGNRPFLLGTFPNGNNNVHSLTLESIMAGDRFGPPKESSESTLAQTHPLDIFIHSLPQGGYGWYNNELYFRSGDVAIKVDPNLPLDNDASYVPPSELTYYNPDMDNNVLLNAVQSMETGDMILSNGLAYVMGADGQFDIISPIDNDADYIPPTSNNRYQMDSEGNLVAIGGAEEDTFSMGNALNLMSEKGIEGLQNDPTLQEIIDGLQQVFTQIAAQILVDLSQGKSTDDIVQTAGDALHSLTIGKIYAQTMDYIWGANTSANLVQGTTFNFASVNGTKLGISFYQIAVNLAASVASGKLDLDALMDDSTAGEIVAMSIASAMIVEAFSTAGAAIGSAIPGVGTAVGSFVGMVIGTIVAIAAGEELLELWGEVADAHEGMWTGIKDFHSTVWEMSTDPNLSDANFESLKDLHNISKDFLETTIIEPGKFTHNKIHDFLGDPINTLADFIGIRDDKWTYRNGSTSDDVMHSDSEWEDIHGAAGKDVMLGYNGWNRFYGGDGNDILFGGDGSLTTNGNARPDEIYGGAGDDYINGKGHHDDLYGNAGADWIEGGEGNDLIYGGDRPVPVGENYEGGPHEFYSTGPDGNDTLLGGASDDRIFGGAGNDIIQGGIGQNVMTGGTGRDTFIIEPNAGGFEVITDFNLNEDVIDITRAGAAVVKTYTMRDVWEFGADKVQLWHKASGTLVEIGDQTILLEGIRPEQLGSQHFAGNVTLPPPPVVVTPGGGGSSAGGTPGSTITTSNPSTSSVVTGTGGNDVIDYSTSQATNQLSGGTGSDIIKGGAARDILQGNEGNDQLTGNGGG
ncbi:MAG: hypothetical protein K0R63_381 [Rickettsiales bacterium]|jgi:hypothetical protein|nr:hypothetical protein [Rickettsiales bacterium]